MEVVSRYDIDRSKVSSFWLIACAKCGAEGLTRRATNKNHKEGGDERIFANRLRAMGWDVGNSLKSPVCPDCEKAAKLRRKSGRVLAAVSEDAMTKAPTVVPMRADPPPTPTPAALRRIRDALDIAYDLDSQGYSIGHTDESVAKELDLPRAWVTDLREQMYGPELNQDIARVLPEVRAFDDRLTELNRANQRVAETLATLVKDHSILREKLKRAGVK